MYISKIKLPYGNFIFRLAFFQKILPGVFSDVLLLHGNALRHSDQVLRRGLALQHEEDLLLFICPEQEAGLSLRIGCKEVGFTPVDLNFAVIRVFVVNGQGAAWY